jgi:hypothetical protein
MGAPTQVQLSSKTMSGPRSTQHRRSNAPLKAQNVGVRSFVSMNRTHSWMVAGVVLFSMVVMVSISLG